MATILEPKAVRPVFWSFTFGIASYTQQNDKLRATPRSCFQKASCQSSLQALFKSFGGFSSYSPRCNPDYANLELMSYCKTVLAYERKTST